MNDHSYLTSAQITSRLEISLRQLYYWELKGVIQPQMITLGSRTFKRYSSKDVETLKRVKTYLDEGYTLTKSMEKAAAHSATPANS